MPDSLSHFSLPSSSHFSHPVILEQSLFFFVPMICNWAADYNNNNNKLTWITNNKLEITKIKLKLTNNNKLEITKIKLKLTYNNKLEIEEGSYGLDWKEHAAAGSAAELCSSSGRAESFNPKNSSFRVIKIKNKNKHRAVGITAGKMFLSPVSSRWLPEWPSRQIRRRFFSVRACVGVFFGVPVKFLREGSKMFLSPVFSRRHGLQGSFAGDFFECVRGSFFGVLGGCLRERRKRVTSNDYILRTVGVWMGVGLSHKTSASASVTSPTVQSCRQATKIFEIKKFRIPTV